MFKRVFAICALGLVAFSHADSHWSGWATIVKIESNWTATRYHLAGGTNNTCAGGGYPLLAATSGAGYDEYQHKKALLLTAFSQGLKVNLRCENDKLSDFEVTQP